MEDYFDQFSGVNPGTLYFKCNICGSDCLSQIIQLEREEPSCGNCKSTVRMRGIVNGLSIALFKKGYTIIDFPVRKDIKGIGMSDWPEYANRLKEKFSYTNTFFHKTPFLDIKNVNRDLFETLDFVISSDVFEHISPPVGIAFENTFRLLKPGGVLVFSVPYNLNEETIEHFPELFDWRLEKNDDWILINNTNNGVKQMFRNLLFHGGEGQTLEMRKFCEKDLIKNLISVGFEEVEFLGDSFYEFGVHWSRPWSLPLLARKPKE